MRINAAIFIASFLFAGPALACNDFVTLDKAQITSDYATLQDAGKGEIDRILAFNNLKCSDDDAIRAAATKAAWLSNVETLQSEATWEFLSSRPLLVIKLGTTDNMSKAHYDVLKERDTVTLLIHGAFADENCLSLYYNDRCTPSYAVTVNGRQVDIYQSGVGTGTFRINNGQLSGSFSLERDRQILTFPATITLF